MARPPASIVVTADSWLGAQSCVDRLKSRLGVRDEIIVAIADEFGVGTGPAQGSVRSITGAPEEIHLRAAVMARHDHLVFVEPVVLTTGHWLDVLLAAFEDGSVVAAGPTIVEAGSADALRELGRTWAKDHRDELHDTDELRTTCMAVRRDAFVEAGDLASLRGRRVIVCGALVGVIAAAQQAEAHVERDGPLVSACLIVRDEEDNLARCLASIAGFADEIVVYDTGSVDATIEVAQRAGATVIEGEWTDDFAGARNAALESCTGEWILWIDADEALVGDRDAFRAVLDANPSVDTISVAIDNLDESGSAVGYTNHALKVFRRARAHWQGRLHEQVVPRDKQSELRPGYTEHVRVLHAGYVDDDAALQRKSERNIRIAEAELADGTDRAGIVLVNLGRSLASADRLAEALARFEEALVETDKSAERRLALRHGAEALLDSGMPGAALDWIARLRDESRTAVMADYLEAIANADLGDEAAALDALLDLRNVSDEDGFAIPDHVLRLRRALLLRNAQRWSECADQLLAIVSDDLAPPWGMLAEAHWRARRDADEVAAVISEKQLTNALGQLLTVTPDAADRVVEALHKRWGDDAAVLAAASAVAARCSVTRALEWSARLRRAGLDGQCPLLGIAGDTERPVAERLQAACVAAGAFADERAQGAIASVAPEIAEHDLLEALIQVGELAPGLLPRFVMAAATDADRTIALADALDALGAGDVAADLRASVRS